MLRGSNLAWCALVAVELVLGAMACSAGSSSQTGTPRPTLTLPPLNQSPTVTVSAPGIPILTAQQRQLTEQIIRDDQIISALAGSSPISLGIIGPYIESAKDNKDILLGATTKVTLTQPHDVEGVEVPQDSVRRYYGFWPDELQARYSPWMDRTQMVSARNLSQFDVDVDLLGRRVAAIWIYSIDYLNQELTQPTPYTNPFFTGDRSKEAESIAKRHPAVAAVLDAIDSTSTKSYAYEIGSHRFAGVWASSDSLFPASGDWPVLVDQDPETGDYRSETVYVSGNAANTVWVTVDLDTRTVIDISTSERD